MAATVSELEGDFASVAETASILRVNARTIRRRCADGSIPAIKPGDWRIPVAWLKKAAGGET